MKEYGFEFAVLRYVHDPITQEFINIGIVLYSPETGYVKARIDYGLTRMFQVFPSAQPTRLRGTLQYLESQVANFESSLTGRTISLRHMLEFILAEDDSSLVFGGYGGGLACDLGQELDRLFDRMVMRYVSLGLERVISP